MKSGSDGFLPFALPDIGVEEIDEVVDSLRSGWVTTGPKARRFEDEFIGYLGDSSLHAVAVNSATAGLHLAVEAIGIRPGDKVVTTTHTFTATAEVIRYMGADPVFVDISLDSYCMDLERVAAAVSLATKAVIPVHYGGLACDMKRLNEIAKGRDLRIVEDAAHALPSRVNGELIGTLNSAATVFSFYATKTITTGEGGMLVTRNKEIAARARIMRLHGIDRDAFDRYRTTTPAWAYEVIAPGFKYNLTDIAAAIGIQQLRKADRFHARRCALAGRYDEQLSGLPLILPPRPRVPSDHAWHLYVVRLPDDFRVERDEVIRKLYSLGIGASVHYVPLHMQPYWKDRYNLEKSQFPNSQKLFERGISLPLYTRMSDDDQQRVIDALVSCL
jgi:dTDP-4-amino-4,6-dideoxygalactose transaminase